MVTADGAATEVGDQRSNKRSKRHVIRLAESCKYNNGGGKNASYPNPRPGADVRLWALVFGHECAAIMGDGLVFGGGGSVNISGSGNNRLQSVALW